MSLSYNWRAAARSLAAVLLASAALLPAGMARAQEVTDGPGILFQDALVDKLAGEWKITRQIRGKVVENRATARWILNHQFLELRMTDAAVPPAYEALVLIGYEHADHKYVMYWCDTFGGKFSARAEGRRFRDAIEFIFAYPDGPFHNTFTWDEKAKTWTSRMESEGKDGKLALFAEDTYRRP